MYLALSILMILPLTKVMFYIHKQLTHIPIFHRTTTTSATTITRFTTNPTSVYLQPCFTSPSQCILSTPALRPPALLAPVCPPGAAACQPCRCPPGSRPSDGRRPAGPAPGQAPARGDPPARLPPARPLGIRITTLMLPMYS